VVGKAVEATRSRKMIGFEERGGFTMWSPQLTTVLPRRQKSVPLKTVDKSPCVQKSRTESLLLT